MDKRLYNYEGMNYVVYTPESGDTSGLPLMVYLHGAGERGTDAEHLDRHAIPKMIKQGREYEAVVLCPQCPARFVWDNVVVQVKAIIDKTAAEYGIKKDRICLTGSSMGGFGTWMMGLTYRNFFSAIAPVAGGMMIWRSRNLCKTPVYIVHGEIDDAVPVVHSRMAVTALKAIGAEVQYTELEGFGHNDAIEKAYSDPALTDWLLKQRRTDFDYVPEALEELF